MNLLVEFIIAIYIILFIFLQKRLDFLTKIPPRALMMSSLCFCRTGRLKTCVIDPELYLIVT